MSKVPRPRDHPQVVIWVSFSLEFDVAALSAFVAGIGLIFTDLTYFMNAKAQRLTVLKQLDEELRERVEARTFSDNYPQWGVDFLNELDKIRYYTSNRLIKKRDAMLHVDDFELGLGLLKQGPFKNCEKSFSNLIIWSDNNNILPR